MKVRRVLALVMAVLMVIGLMPVVAAVDVTPPMTDAEGKVTFTKDFVRDDNNNPVVDDGYYTIKISVSGKPYTVETTPNADVILVVDNSGSMATSVGDKCTEKKENFVKSNGKFLGIHLWDVYTCGKCGARYSTSLDIPFIGFLWDDRPNVCTGEIGTRARIDAAKEVSKTFANSILSVDGNQLAVIGFAHKAGESVPAVRISTNLVDKNKKNVITEAIDKMDADGGTDYTAAFTKAQEILNERTVNTRPAYIIFISDGAPGLYSDDPKHDDANWNGSAQITALKNAGVKIYTIGIKLDEGASNYMREIATDTDHYKNVQTTDYESEMKSILAEWAKHINSVPAGKKAKVVDVVNTNDFVVNVDALPKNAKYENSTITWEFDEITEDAQCISFKVKPKEELDTGDYNTNGDCVLNYVDGKTNQEINPALTADSPSIHVDKEETTYTVTYKYDNSVPAEVMATLPKNEYTYAVGQKVTTARPNPDVVDAGGYRWTFKAWQYNGTEVYSNTQIPMEEGGLTFVGIWTAEALPAAEYGVTYKYDNSVPAEVMATLPKNEYTYAVGQKVTTARPNPDV
ncbi:MAG: VWA domain-containing protein, partial [Clostridiales bacterium]|nr:VWA domain-containing protein [Clostridiales bacterium]